MSSSEEPKLDFDKADFGVATEGVKCGVCASPIHDAYYEAGGLTICRTCRAQVAASEAPDGGLRRLGAATVLGIGGGVVGAIAWYAVAKLFNLEIGLIAILVGWLVGRGVHIGSEGRGGWQYQLLAAVVAYASIVTTYVPAIIEGLAEDGGDLSGRSYAFAFAFAFVVPFWLGFSNILGILILGFAVHQAWSMNRRRVIDVKGPFQVSGRAALLPVAGDAAAS